MKIILKGPIARRYKAVVALHGDAFFKKLEASLWMVLNRERLRQYREMKGIKRPRQFRRDHPLWIE